MACSKKTWITMMDAKRGNIPTQNHLKWTYMSTAFILSYFLTIEKRDHQKSTGFKKDDVFTPSRYLKNKAHPLKPISNEHTKKSMRSR